VAIGFALGPYDHGEARASCSSSAGCVLFSY